MKMFRVSQQTKTISKTNATPATEPTGHICLIEHENV